MNHVSLELLAFLRAGHCQVRLAAWEPRIVLFWCEAWPSRSPQEHLPFDYGYCVVGSVMAGRLTGMDATLLTGLTGAGALALGSGLTWVASRRKSSGRIGTSEADVLGDQAQAMRAELVAQRDKAMEQRDRLIESQTAQLLPTIAAVSASLRTITESLARLESKLWSEATAPPISPPRTGVSTTW